MIVTLVPLRAGLVLPLSSQSLSRLRRDIFCGRGTLVTTLTTAGLVTVDSTLVRKRALIAGLSGSSNTLKAGTVVLAVVVALVLDLIAGLARTGVTETLVDVLRRGSLQGIRCGGLD